jgi:putative nucleotidyltransferase with HDIG domain
MKFDLRYRVWQFFQSLKGSPDPLQWDRVRAILNPSELNLFEQLPVPDQNHSLRVLDTLESEGEQDPDLLKAALLHDIGKTLHPLRRWERVFAVILQRIFPRSSARWGRGQPRGVFRALVVIHQHPDWGANLAAEVGSGEQVVRLIRYHEQEDLTGLLDQGGVELLKKLQLADNIN